MRRKAALGPLAALLASDVTGERRACQRPDSFVGLLSGDGALATFRTSSRHRTADSTWCAAHPPCRIAARPNSIWDQPIDGVIDRERWSDLANRRTTMSNGIDLLTRKLEGSAPRRSIVRGAAGLALGSLAFLGIGRATDAKSCRKRCKNHCNENKSNRKCRNKCQRQCG